MKNFLYTIAIGFLRVVVGVFFWFIPVLAWIFLWKYLIEIGFLQNYYWALFLLFSPFAVIAFYLIGDIEDY